MYRENGSNIFYQWELNQRLIVTEFCTMVQYDNGTMPTALGCEVKTENGVRYAEVPNILLQTAAPLHVYAWNEETTSVVGHRVFDVEARAKPAQYAYTQTEVKQYDILVTMLQERGAYYVPTVDEEGNLSWSKTVDHMPDVPEVSIRGPQGDKGNPGAPGVSPKVEVTKIDGGHRVTITDKDGTNTFDVMDGKDGEGGTGGGLEPLVVDLRAEYHEESGDYTASHDSLQIIEHLEKGGDVFGLAGTGTAKIKIPLSGIMERDVGGNVYKSAQFQWDAGTRLTNLSVTEDGYVVETVVVCATADDIGDLDAALAEILDYAQSLTGGGES